MSSQIIVELNQADTNNSVVNSNGDYNTTLKKPVILNKGDQLQLKSSFIDTRVANSQKINVQGDIVNGVESNQTTISITFGYYKTDVKGSFEDEVGTITHEGRLAYAGAYQNLFTGRPFPAFKQVATPDNIYLDITSMTMKIVLGNTKGYNSNFVILDSDGKSKVYNFYFKPGFEKTYGRFIQQDRVRDYSEVTINQDFLDIVLPDVDAFESNIKSFPFIVHKPVAPKTIDSEIIAPNSDIIGLSTQPHASPAGGTDELYTSNISFKIDSGLYDADAIAEIINQKCTEIDLDGDLSAKSYELSRNPLLKSIQQIRVDEDVQLSFIDIDEDPQQCRRFTYNTGDGSQSDANIASLRNLLNYYIGSSQFGLSFNDQTQKMEMLQMHNSLYSGKFNSKDDTAVEKRGTAINANQTPEIRLLRNRSGNQNIDTKYIVNKNCGIFFTNLEPKSLWFDGFKFDPSILVGQKVLTKTFVNTGTHKIMAPANFNDGSQLTCDEAGLDEIITKNINVQVNAVPDYIAGTFSAFDIATPIFGYDGATISDDSGEIFANTTQTRSITANEKIGEDIQSEGGFYKIAIDMNGVKSDLRGFGENNTIQSIISKYYSQSSFTSSYSEGSIAYVHNSDEPLYLNSFRVRILDPNNKLSPNIGSKNCVFIEIVKA